MNKSKFGRRIILMLTALLCLPSIAGAAEQQDSITIVFPESYAHAFMIEETSSEYRVIHADGSHAGNVVLSSFRTEYRDNETVYHLSGFDWNEVRHYRIGISTHDAIVYLDVGPQDVGQTIHVDPDSYIPFEVELGDPASQVSVMFTIPNDTGEYHYLGATALLRESGERFSGRLTDLRKDSSGAGEYHVQVNAVMDGQYYLFRKQNVNIDDQNRIIDVSANEMQRLSLTFGPDIVEVRSLCPHWNNVRHHLCLNAGVSDPVIWVDKDMVYLNLNVHSTQYPDGKRVELDLTKGYEWHIELDADTPAKPESVGPVQVDVAPSLEPAIEQKPIEDVAPVPANVEAKSDAFVIRFPEPVEEEVPVSIQLDPAVLEGVDPKKVSIWQYVDPDAVSSKGEHNGGAVRIAESSRGYWEPIGGKVDLATGKVTGYISGSGTYAVMLSNRTFADIQNHPYRYEIEVLLAQGIINGYNENEFRPNNGISRAEFAKVIVKAAHVKQVRGSSPFQDVGPTHWANVFVASAARAGLVNGYSADRFGPNDPILREQAAAIAERAGGVKQPGAAAAERALNQVQDRGQISDYARSAAAGVLEAGMMEPVNGGFRPKEPASRAVVAKLIMELMVNLGYL
jgi:hypothetical protein